MSVAEATEVDCEKAMAEIPLAKQAKLLAFLDSSTIQRIGGATDHSVMARLISATS